MNTIIGLFAHVDAGKTTLSESILYQTQSIKSFGRVDKKDSFLDYETYERNKGITVIAKEARFKYQDKNYILVDTPGHLDFLSEVNRTSKIIDLAILIIDGKEEIPIDTIKKYNYLRNEDIPIIIFVNKMDISFENQEEIINKLRNKLSSSCLKANEVKELLELHFEKDNISNKQIYEAMKDEIITPIIFGSALKQEGINELLDFINNIDITYDKSDKLKAYVYKIDEYVHLKVMSGTLQNKSIFNDEKINEIILLNGQNKEMVQSVEARDLCAIKGIKNIEVGTYLPSFFKDSDIPIQSLKYRIITDLDNKYVYDNIKILNIEYPELNIEIDDKDIFIDIIGELQKDFIKELIQERFNIQIDYSNPLIKYEETIEEESIGVGHYEPLGHYAEVILKISPSNIYKIKCNEDSANKNNIKNYFETYRQRGILTNSYLNNIQIEILDLKTHNKHTQGQDLIEASKRALRNALIKNKNILLEPYFITNIKTDFENHAKIIAYISSHKYTFTIEEDNIMTKIPMYDYNETILYFNHLFKDDINIQIENKIYDKANNQDEIIERINYDYLNDIRNPCGSVFYHNGQRIYVEPLKVEEYMHLDINNYIENKNNNTFTYNKARIDEEELRRVWNSLYKEKPRYKEKNKEKDNDINSENIYNNKPILYLIDGYNLMHEMNDIDLNNLIIAREKVIDLVCDFAGYINGECILVFDAYKTNNNRPSVSKERNITLVYTKHKQSADMYIERKTEELEKDYHINVVTSDALEQMMIFSHSALRLSSREFLNRYENFKKNSLLKQEKYINRPLEKLKELLEED